MTTRSPDRVWAHQQRLRAPGLRPIQIRVPEVGTPQFAAEAHRQSRLLTESPTANDDQTFVDEIADWPGE